MAQAPAPRTEAQSEELREFLIVVRNALLLIVRWIEKRYHLNRTV